MLNFDLLHAPHAMLRTYGYALASQSSYTSYKYMDRRKRLDSKSAESECAERSSEIALQYPTDTAAAVVSHITTHFSSYSQPSSDVCKPSESELPVNGSLQRNSRDGKGVERQRERYSPGCRQDRSSRRGRGGDYRRGKRKNSRTVGRGEREQAELRVRERESDVRSKTEAEPRGVGVSKQKDGEGRGHQNQKGRQANVGIGGGVQAGTMIEAGRARKKEREMERGSGEGELSGTESVNSHAERLGRYLCANLSFEPDGSEEEEEGGWLVLDGYGDMAGADEIPTLEDDLLCLAYPAHHATVTAALAEPEGLQERAPEQSVVAASGEQANILLDDDQFSDYSGDEVRVSGTLEHTLPQEMVYDADRDGGSGVRCEGEVWRREGGEGESEDDGWISDTGETAALFQSSALEMPAVQLPPYAMYEDDIWVDEAKAIFAKHKEDTKKLEELLTEMFSIHTDVYSLLLAFVRRAGKTRHPPKSVSRITLATFQKWLRRVKEKDGQEDPHTNPPVLREEHQQRVLALMTRSHLVLMDDICQIFQLHSADVDLLIELVQDLLAENKRKEAVTYAWTFHLQSHFGLDEMLLPLIAMDKINLIENYIEEDRELQEEFVTLLDRLCHSGGRLLAGYAQRLGLEANGPNSKLSAKQLFKLALRLAKMYDLDLDKFPGLASQRLSMCLHHLLRQRYVEGNITDSNMEDLIAAAIRSHPGLQHQLIRELIHHGDMNTAAHWAAVYHVPLNTLPLSVQFILMNQTPSSTVEVRGGGGGGGRGRRERERSPTEYLQLSLPLDSIHFVNNGDTLRKCQHRLAQKGAIIGVDAEWRLPICNGGKERMALMQLAVSDAVYLLDMIALPQCLSKSQLRAFLCDVFTNKSTTKLGYSIEGDLDLLIRSWSFAADILSSPVRVVDVQTLADMVSNLQSQAQAPPPELPVHPLVLGNFESGSPKSSRPPYTPPISHKIHAEKTSSDHPVEPNPPDLRGSPEVEFYDPLSLEGSLETGKCRGLSLLVQRELGRPLKKSEQLSDWEKRPLSPEQIRYAALDALCLLQLYTVLTTQALAIDPHFNTEPSIPPPRISRSLLRKIKEPTTGIQPKKIPSTE